jgi:hypothetical protein
LEANGMRSHLQANIRRTIENAPVARREDLKKIFNLEEIVSEILPLYDRAFTQDELIALVSFYESPVGTKLMEVSPQLVQEAAEAALKYIQKKLVEK